MKDAKGHGSNPRGVTSAAAERIALNRALDARHYPPRTDADVAAATDLSRPQGSVSATPGRFNAAQMGLHAVGVHLATAGKKLPS
jgi:hypothetical protein